MAGIGLFRIFDPKVRRHLISDEGEVVIDEVRHHWVVFTVRMLEVVLAAALLLTMATTSIGGRMPSGSSSPSIETASWSRTCA
jgi:hypothetical protein